MMVLKISRNFPPIHHITTACALVWGISLQKRLREKRLKVFRTMKYMKT